jgi:hypothetical protein
MKEKTMNDLDYKIKVMEASKNGMAIQYRVHGNPNNTWYDVAKQPTRNWAEGDYRIKVPEPVRACQECGKEIPEHASSVLARYATGDYCSGLCADVADLRYMMHIMEKHNES